MVLGFDVFKKSTFLDWKSSFSLGFSSSKTKRHHTCRIRDPHLQHFSMHLLQQFLILVIFRLVCPVHCAATIQWGPCEAEEFNTTLNLECASVNVPLDYTNPSSSKLDLGIVKIPALGNSSRGSILHNFGGPGLEARQTLIELGPILQQ